MGRGGPVPDFLEGRDTGMSIPKITVLMSVYNGKTFLAEAIASILTQTFQAFEFLIIDDGSSEPLERMVQSFGDERIRLHRHENVGLTRSLNKGLTLARGEYVARMDADDVSLPSRLEAQVAALDGDKRLDLVGSFFDVIDADGNLIERKELITDEIYRLWRLLFHNNYGHGTMMMRKNSIIQAKMYDETLQFAQDYDFWSRISAKGNTAMIPESLYLYRMVKDGDQASVKNYDTQLAAAVQISNRNLAACNPSLTAEQCMEARALYWKFQREHVSGEGLRVLPNILEGFCRRYELLAEERAKLARKVAVDVMNEAQVAADLPSSALSQALTRLRRMAG
jgi:glycosyltransferase involved in cell wall biosynthesis